MLSLNQLSALASKIISICALTAILVACGGSGGGSSGTTTPTTPGGGTGGGSSAPEVINYNGPAPSSDEVQRYRNAIWSNIALASRCGGCHIDGGSATPTFARTDDINAAYAEAVNNNLINTSNPSNSRLATKVGEGHNCWLTNAGSCAAQMATWVSQFSNVGGDTSFLGALNLQEPTLRTVGDSKQFPALATDGGASSFANTVYPLLNQYCGGCHAPDSATQQQPYLGGNNSNSGVTDPEDVTVSYEAARTRINLGDGARSVSDSLSRLIVRLRDERHQCWDSTRCVTDMHSAIQAFSNGITPVSVDPALVVSRELNLDEDGQAASGGGRVETNVIAKWDFRDNSSNPSTRTADDTSGVSPPLTLNLIGDVEWSGAAGGVRINDGKLQGSTTTSAKLYDRIIASGEYSIEAWVVPLNITQDGPARIVTYSGATDRRNFMLGQTTYDYDFQARSSVTDADGLPALSTPMADEVLQATLQHVVATYSATDGRRIYVNGELVTADDPEGPGNFNSWDRNFALVVGDEVSNDNQWQGTVRLLAIHDRAISEADIRTNFDIGVGQKFYLLFYISDHISIPRSYIVMEVEQFDSHSYLFNEPFFVSFEPGVTITDVPIQGIRIGINGQEASAGQAYANLDETITQAEVDANEGRQVLSDIGAVIGVDQGAERDNFFLTFDLLGSEQYVRVEATPTAQNPVADNDKNQWDIGIKTFDEINEALSGLTGISKTTPSIASTFDTVRQQLPIDEDIEGFSAAQQMAVTQLSVVYCKALVDQESALSSSSYFENFDFGATPTVALGGAGSVGRGQIISPLLDSLLANTVRTNDQPDIADTQSELDSLITTLLDNCDNNSCIPPGSSSTSRLNDIVTATCASAFASGMMLIQ